VPIRWLALSLSAVDLHSAASIGMDDIVFFENLLSFILPLAFYGFDSSL
jgi:hypothetical protein